MSGIAVSPEVDITRDITPRIDPFFDVILDILIGGLRENDLSRIAACVHNKTDRNFSLKPIPPVYDFIVVIRVEKKVRAVTYAGQSVWTKIKSHDAVVHVFWLVAEMRLNSVCINMRNGL